jgi:formamidase
MVTSSFRGGHEVTRPIRAESAEVGDAVAINIRALGA